MGAPLFAGPLVTIGGQPYTLPALSFGAFADAKDKIRAIAEGGFSDPVDLSNAVAQVIHAALQRNYPELEIKTLLYALDWGTAQQVFSLLLRISVPGGTPGEMRVESPYGPLTGLPPSQT